VLPSSSVRETILYAKVYGQTVRFCGIKRDVRGREIPWYKNKKQWETLDFGDLEASNKKQWETLDFGDLEASVLQLQQHDTCHQAGPRLSEDDLVAVLVCIDAANTLKSLALSNCHHITGVGLEPLRGTTTLQGIDLSVVVGGRSKTGDNDNAEAVISAGVVIPILDSIIETVGNALLHIQLPKKWRLEGGQMLNQFLTRYNGMLRAKSIVCSKSNCDNVCEGGANVSGDPIISLCPFYPRVLGSSCYGFQSMTCSSCKKSFCGVCKKLGIFPSGMGFCPSCEKFYCDDCNPVGGCVKGCNSAPACLDCSDWTYCDISRGCGKPICGSCRPIVTRCCDKTFCRVEEALDCCKEVYDYWSS